MKSFVTITAIIGLGLIFFMNTKNDDQVVVKKDKGMNYNVLTSSNPSVVAEKAEKRVSALDEFKSMYTHLSSKEIKEKIANMEAEFDRKKIFPLLNENKITDGQKKELVTILRLKQALTMIVLERQLDATEEDYL